MKIRTETAVWREYVEAYVAKPSWSEVMRDEAATAMRDDVIAGLKLSGFEVDESPPGSYGEFEVMTHGTNDEEEAVIQAIGDAINAYP